jgi:hypothetical protein
MSGKIQGPALLGFVEEFEAYVGAAGKTTGKPPAKQPPTPPGAKPAGVPKLPVKTTSKPSPHKKAVLNVANAGKAAMVAAQKAVQHVAAKPPVPPPRVHVGATLTTKQQAAVNAHKRASALSAAATSRVTQLAKKAHAAGADAAKTANNLATYLKNKLGGKATKSHVGACIGYIHQRGGVENLTDEEVLGLAAILGDDAAPPTDPSASPPPGPSLDSSTTLPPDTSTSATGVVTAPDGTVVYDPSTDPAVLPMPTRGQPLPDDEAQSPRNNITDDAIVYDGSQGFPRYSLGSYYYFNGPQNTNGGMFGMVWGYDHMNWPNSGDPIRWIKRFGQAAGTNNDNWDDGFGTDAKNASAAASESAKSDPRNLPAGKIYGPLIGNPNTNLAGLQYAVQDQKWFWQGDYAPAWAAAEADDKIKLANKKTIAANTAAAQLQVAQMIKDAADAKAQQAAQDAQNALAESQAASQAAVAQSQAQAAQASQETQAQQLLLDQAKAEQQQRAAEAQQQLEAGKILLQQAQSMPPGSFAQPQDQGYDGQGGDYGDDQGYDDNNGGFADDGANQGYSPDMGDPFADQG